MINESDLYELLRAEVAALVPQMVQTRRLLHRHPEVGWLEFRTAVQVCDELESLGFAIRAGHQAVSGEKRMGVPDDVVIEKAWERARASSVPSKWFEAMRGGYTGVIADLDTGRPGKRIAFRFDLDALPIKESVDADHRPTNEGWASEFPGTMHACGHDGHVSIGLALSRLIMKLKDHLSGRIRLIFQPAEEGVRGAVAMTNACEGVDRLFCLHLGLGLPTGTVVGGAVKFLATQEICAHIHGMAAHAGLEPEVGRSALLAAAQATLALHTLPQNASHLVRVNVGILNGGIATNIVPPDAELYYRIRTDDNDAILELDERARQAVIASAATYGCSVELELTGQADTEDSHSELAATVTELAETIRGVTNIMQHRPFGASDDATHLMKEIHQQGGQSTYILIGADLTCGHHTQCFDFDEHSMAIGLELLGRISLRFLG